MTGRKTKSWETYMFEYTDIKNTDRAKHKGSGNQIRRDQLDEFVGRQLKDWKDDNFLIMNMIGTMNRFSQIF